MIKIVEKTDEKEPVRFKDLEVGQSFLWEDDEYLGPYRKTNGGYLRELGSQHTDVSAEVAQPVIPIYSKLIWSRKEEV